MAHDRGHALVLGGSIAGLLAARVLADTHRTVTVVDRDPLPAATATRPSVPQDRHSHALLARGRDILEELLPGLTEELVKEGAPAGDLLGDARWYVNGNLLARADSGLVALAVSRPLLENYVRTRIRQLPNVSIVDRCTVAGLLATVDGSRVVGARLRRPDGPGETERRADLVVDATGRGSRTPQWLAELGYQPPAEDRVDVDVRYSTWQFRLTPGVMGRDVAVVVGRTAKSLRGGVLQRLEGDVCILTLSGMLGDRPPTDPAGFLEFVRGLPVPDVHEIIADAEPIGTPVAYRFPSSTRRRYERLTELPRGLLVTGDAVCAFNPQYAQGMSVAALDALALREELHGGGEPSPARYFQAVAAALEAPWRIAVGGDLTIPGVAGHRTRMTRFMGAYLRRLHAAAAVDTTLSTAFLRVTGLVDAPHALLRPALVRRVLTHHLGSMFRANTRS